MKNSSATVDNINLLDLQNSSYPTQRHSMITKYDPLQIPVGTLTLE